MRRVREQCAVKHRSDSVARSTPTRAQRGTRPKNHTDVVILFLKIKLPACIND
ncbi:MAG: hypothetical protein NZ455_10765 [Bacteroidia bacterium]|nr:hypothetical protein [Bacteroidia bacterium]MDW8347600.1 hypothetical protein [Bacteroidia bacterium]